MTEVQKALIFIEEKKPVIFDIGANDGNYTKEILNLCPDALIYAFEPDEDREIFKINDVRVRHHMIALSSTQERRTLYKPENLHSHNAFHVRPHFNLSTLTSSVCECTTVDLFANNNKIEKIDFLKIDTEGNEIEILLGAKQSLSNRIINAGQFEYGGTWRERGFFLFQAYDFLTKLGYQIFDVNDSGQKIQIGNDFKDDWNFRNFYFHIKF